MDALAEAEALMDIVQEQVKKQEVISGEALLQVLDRKTALAQAQQLSRIANALEALVQAQNEGPR